MCSISLAINGSTTCAWEIGEAGINVRFDLLFYPVLRARNLLPADPNGKSDPYCSISVGGSTAHKTDVQSATLYPVWKQSVVFLSEDLEPYATFRGALTRLGQAFGARCRFGNGLAAEPAMLSNNPCSCCKCVLSDNANRLSNFDTG